jgi:type II secretory pathway component PulJ
MKTLSLLFMMIFITLNSPFTVAAEEQQKTMTEKEMQERLKQMEKELAEIRQTKNPEERTRLMHEHMGHMRGMMMDDDMGCDHGNQMMGH